MLSTKAMICVVIFVIMILLTLGGVPISHSLFGATIIGFFVVGGWGHAGFNTAKAVSAVMAQLKGGLFTQSASYNFAVVPFFIALGALAGDTGIAGDAFQCMETWLNRRKGGLLYAITLANGIFGACSGVSSAASMVFSKISYPELKKLNYDEGNALACVSTAGCLSSLIPPSVGILIFCMLTDMSIGTGLLCGFASGLLVILVLFVMIAISVRIHPEYAPEAAKEKPDWIARLKTLKLLVPIGVLFALIVCGPYLGWFPSTVGGAVGLIAILIYTLIKRMPLKKIATGLWDGTCNFAGVFMMVIGGQFFGRFVSYTGLAKDLANGLASMNVSVYVLFVIFVIFFLFLGCFMNVMPILTITIPILYPVFSALGFNGYALMMSALLLAETGAITPPVGMAVFMVGSVCGVSATTIFKRIIPYFIALVIVALVMGFFPITITWLPQLLGASVA